MPWVLFLVLENLKSIVCSEIYTETEDWPPPFLASVRNHQRGCFLIQTISSTHSFVLFFDALRLLNIDSNFLLLMYRYVFAVEFNPYFDDITVTTLLFVHLTKAILELPSITTLADPLSSFSISFNCWLQWCLFNPIQLH